jgi:hypothetical protein
VSLADQVNDAVKMGCTRADKMLGFQKMPEGYALMLDADRMYFFWLRHDGCESVIHWNKWAVRAGAINDGQVS